VFTNILVGVDGRPSGRDAIALARQLGTPGGQIKLAHIYGGAWILSGAAGRALASGRKHSAELLGRERAAASLEARLISQPARSVGRGLHELAERNQADLLVVGSRGRSLVERVLTGDHTIASLNGARCAVAIAPNGYRRRTDRFAKIGVGHNGTPESEQALQAARGLAARHRSEITAIAVVSLQSMPKGEQIPVDWTQITEQLLWEERHRLARLEDVEADVRYGDPSEELAQIAEGLDLLVVGSRSYGPVDRLFSGSTSNYLARHTPCPLLVLPRVLLHRGDHALHRSGHAPHEVHDHRAAPAVGNATGR
jgi:nucleotide-binding universal stress UspA family protein